MRRPCLACLDAGDLPTLARLTPAEALSLPNHAYSASGEVTARVVYAGTGTPEDYTRLGKRWASTCTGRIVLVRYAVPYSYRGFNVF